jgi:hypothetical protein
MTNNEKRFTVSRRGFFGTLGTIGVGAVLPKQGPDGLPSDRWLQGLEGGSIIVHQSDAILLPRMGPGVSVVTDPTCPREQAFHEDDGITLRIQTLSELHALGLPIEPARAAELLGFDLPIHYSMVNGRMPR